MIPALVVTADDLDAATRTVWGEARNQLALGQLAVAWVIRTRATWDRVHGDHPEHEWWGTSPAAVCQHPYQFSCWLPKDPNRAKLLALSAADPIYQNLYALAVAVFAGLRDDPTVGGTHYKVTGTSASWDAAVVRLKLQPTIIGAHSFYCLGPQA